MSCSNRTSSGLVPCWHQMLRSRALACEARDSCDSPSSELGHRGGLEVIADPFHCSPSRSTLSYRAPTLESFLDLQGCRFQTSLTGAGGCSGDGICHPHESDMSLPLHSPACHLRVSRCSRRWINPLPRSGDSFYHLYTRPVAVKRCILY